MQMISCCAAPLMMVPAACLADIVPSFTPIAGLPGDNVYATRSYGISGDGKVVYGEVRTTGRWETMVWTAAGGTRAFGPGAPFHSNYDGSMLVGWLGRWTEASGWQAVPAPSGARSPFRATGISRDGAVIVGYAGDANTRDQGTRWSQSAGPTWIPRLPSMTDTQAARVGTSSPLIVGNYSVGGGATWKFDGTTVSELTAQGRHVRDMTPDAATCVGESYGGSACGFVLTLSSLMQIPAVAGHSGGGAHGVSADGRIVVGQAHPAYPHAYIWDSTHSTRLMQDVLTGMGLNLQGFTALTDCTGISDDGTTITGLGVNSRGLEQAWVAVVPGPGSGAVMGMAGFIVCRRRR